MRTSSATEVLLNLARSAEGSLHHQLEQQIREAARSGRLAVDSTMPSTRALAAELGVTRGVVVEAYEQLAAEGYLVARPGGATRVARVATPPARPAAPVDAQHFEIDLRPGRPDLTEFPRAAWLRSIRRALGEAPSERLGYLDGHGVPEPRSALSSYLDRVRGTSTDPADIVITSGFVQGLRLIGRVAYRAGARRAAVEDPWHADYGRVLRSAGLEVVPIPVDEDGIDVERLAVSAADLVVLTPAHQYPTGAVLSAPRRSALLEWAAERRALIVEDDYDAEFRYDREPIGAMQGLGQDDVIYAGTASKTLAPGLRLGWLAVPRRLSEGVARAKLAADYGSAALDQLALADFIERGALDRHLRHMRSIYRARRDALLGGLGRHLPEVTTTGASAGLHVLARLPDGVDEARLVQEAAEAGVGLTGAAETYAQRQPEPGIIFGYATADERRIESGLERLASLSAWRGSR